MIGRKEKKQVIKNETELEELGYKNDCLSRYLT